jgi:hypothetical protein
MPGLPVNTMASTPSPTAAATFSCVAGDPVGVRVHRFEVHRDQPPGQPLDLADDVRGVGHLDCLNRRTPHVEQVQDDEVRSHRRRHLGVADIVNGGHRRGDDLRSEHATLAGTDRGDHLQAAVRGQLACRRVEQALGHVDLSRLRLPDPAQAGAD